MNMHLPILKCCRGALGRFSITFSHVLGCGQGAGQQADENSLSIAGFAAAALTGSEEAQMVCCKDRWLLLSCSRLLLALIKALDRGGHSWGLQSSQGRMMPGLASSTLLVLIKCGV